MRPVAVLDACVLYPAPLRDFFLWAAAAGLFAARWSADIRREWVENLLANRPDLSRDRLDRTCREMDRAVPDALVTGYESLIPTFDLPDPDDRHVVAAAVTSGADWIVTANVRDFPADRMPPGLRAVTPDAFACALWAADGVAVTAVLREHHKSLTRPPKTADEYLATLAKNGLTDFTARIASADNVF